jgi:hypothetical protein
VAEVKTLKLEIIMDETGAVKGVKGLGKASDDLTKDILSNNKKQKRSWATTIIALNQGIELAKKVFNGFKKAFDLSKQFQEYRQGMDALARNTGQNSDMIVAKLKEVADGTVSNKELMLAANRAVALNVTKDMGQVADLLEIARLKAKAMGTDTTSAFNDIVTGIGRGSPLILDNLGIVTKGWAEEAKAAGQAMDAQFILNKVLKDGAVELEKAGEQTISGAERFQQFTAALADTGIKIGKVLTPALAPLLAIMTKIVTFTGNAITKLGGFVSKLTGARVEMEQINKELAKPVLLRINEKRIEQLREGIEATKENNKAMTEELALIKKEVTAYTRGELALKKTSEATREFLSQRKSLNQLEDETIAKIDARNKKVEEAAKELEKLEGIVQKMIKSQQEGSEESMELTEEQLKAQAEAWNNYYTFIGDQRTLDRLQENEAFKQSQEALKLLLEQRQISRQEHNTFMEEVEFQHQLRLAEIDQEAKDLLVERNNIANDLIGKNFEELTLKQKKLVDERLKKERKTTEDITGIWQTAMGNVVANTAESFTDMVFEGKKWGKNFGEVISNIVKSLTKLVFKLLIIKGLKSALGGIGLFAKFGGLMPKLAGGGKLSGPSHKQGGIPVEAEGGEYFVRKERVTSKTLPVLEAINRGIGDIAMMSFPRQIMQEGGPVTSTTNNNNNRTANIGPVNITDPNPQKLFNQFFDYMNDMGVNITRRG